MPQTIPPFSQFQGPMFPLRGLWNAKPQEGDKFVNCEIDWIDSTGGYFAQQFSLSGNSPVALSQIVALSVDNSRCGVDVDFLFPDSGFVLTVPAYNQGVYPVFTNALMFYAVANVAVTSGNKTVMQVLNSMPPPVAIQPSTAQQQAGVVGIDLGTDGSNIVVPATVNGTITGLSILPAFAATGVVGLNLNDGTGKALWADTLTGEAGGQTAPPIVISNLRLRFTRGLNLVLSGTTFSPGTGGDVVVNVFYSIP